MYFKIYLGKAKTHEGKEFVTFYTYDKKGIKTNVGFTKEVVNLPRENSIIEVEAGKANLQTNTRYPKLWIKEIKSAKPFEASTKNEELLKQFEVPEDELPF